MFGNSIQLLLIAFTEYIIQLNFIQRRFACFESSNIIERRIFVNNSSFILTFSVCFKILLMIHIVNVQIKKGTRSSLPFKKL